MTTYTVYRIDYVNKKKIPIAKLAERRKQDRGNNVEEEMLSRAHQLYAYSPIDKHFITIRRG
jgi:hypothetical protein